MSEHPFKEAFIPVDPDTSAAADDISEAVEAYTPFVARAVSDITGRDLARVQHAVLITGDAIRFYKQDTGNTDEEDLVNLTVIKDLEEHPFVLVQRGDRYDLPFGSTGLLGDGEQLPATPIVTSLTLPAGLPGSLAFCDTAPTAQAIVTFKKKTGAGAWTDVFTVTFAAGQITGTFTLAAGATLAYGDRLRPVAPVAHDPTFAGFTATIVATR